MALLEVSGIDVSYGAIQALRGVSLTVGEGEKVALLGANGAGKTTTLRTISGLLHPTAGTITFRGEPIQGLPPQEVVARGIAHLPEGRDLFPTLTVEENLRFGYLPRRKDKASYPAALEQAFTRFPRLKERRRQAAGTLSGGEQQMLAISRALMSHPDLLIVDELSLGLAPIIVEQLFGILNEVNASGTAVLIVEQFVHMALANTDRASVLAKGEIVLSDASANLERNPQLVASYLGEAEVGPEAAAAAPEAPSRTKPRAAAPGTKPRAASSRSKPRAAASRSKPRAASSRSKPRAASSRPKGSE